MVREAGGSAPERVAPPGKSKVAHHLTIKLPSGKTITRKSGPKKGVRDWDASAQAHREGTILNLVIGKSGPAGGTSQRK